MSCRINNQQGIALIVTLLALVLITAMVVEFSYGVYTGTNNLYNWRDSQRLSVMAQSGVNVIARLMKDPATTEDYKTQSEIEMPVVNPFEDFNGTIVVRIEDENAKFNIKTLINQKLQEETDTREGFQRLLRALNLDEKIANRMVDYIIDRNNTTELPEFEVGAKHLNFDSVDELLLINGISRKDYDTLLPYITVYGDGRININSAGKPVLMSLPGEINDSLAENIIAYRKNTPFAGAADIFNVPGFGTLGINLMGRITAQGNGFYIKSTAASDGVKRIIETVLDTNSETIQYWKEY
jgi:general secretion pathway protein K